jgi:hypothetical protein
MKSNFNEVNEFVKTLKPIINWDELSVGTKIFHQDSIDVNFYDEFITIRTDLIPETDTPIVVYKSPTAKEGENMFNRTTSGWYFWESPNV